MKELSIEEKAKRYDEILARAKGRNIPYYKEDIMSKVKEFVDYLIPELAESEDEQMVKSFTRLVKAFYDVNFPTPEGFTREEMLAWLEKIGEQKSLDDIAKEVTKDKDTAISFLKSAGIINENGELADEYKIEQSKPKEHDVCNNCEQQGSCVYPCCVKLVEKNDEQKPADNAESRFKVGDWVMLDRPVLIAKVEYMSYNNTHQYWTSYDTWFGDGTKAKLWTIQDAKDGDVLCTYECDEPKIVFILKGTPKKSYALSYYCFYNIMYPSFKTDDEKGCLAPEAEDIKPATKEQRDLLFQKMKEAGNEWDAEKKELIKIEQKPTEWSEEDIRKIKLICTYLNAYKSYQTSVGTEYIDGCISWAKALIEKVGCEVYCTSTKLWKPSDGQMESIKQAVSNMKNSACYDSELVDLLQDLEKLKE